MDEHHIVADPSTGAYNAEMRIDNEVVIIEQPDDWKHEMLAGAVADPIAARTDRHGVVRIRCHTRDMLPDAKIVVESRLFWLPETIRYAIEFEDEYP